MKKKVNVEQIIADSILSNPMRFEVGGQQFSFYPPSLGQVLMVKEVLSKAGFSWDAFSTNPIAESMRFVGEAKKDALKVVAINLLSGKQDVCNAKAVEKVEKEIASLISNKDLPTLLIAVLTRDNNMIDTIVKNTALNRDRANMQKVMGVKQGKNNFVFGRRTIYGQLIDTACARYGWTFDYVLWDISYLNLQMLVADQEVSVFLSDKELKEVHITNDREVINADDPANRERIKAMFND